VTIPRQHIKEDGDVMRTHCSTAPKHVAALLVGRQAADGKEERRLSRTDVLEQLTKLRNEKLVCLKARHPQERLIMFEAITKRITTPEKIDIPSSVEIDEPTIGEVQGISVKVMMSWKQNAPLFVELNA
jgi:hypothetical protein